MDGVWVAGIGRLCGAAQKHDALANRRSQLARPLALEGGLFLRDQIRQNAVAIGKAPAVSL